MQAEDADLEDAEDWSVLMGDRLIASTMQFMLPTHQDDDVGNTDYSKPA